MGDSRFLTRVVLKNYKSIAACDVQLGSLMFLVGPNGAGRSNFLDALRFVADALRSSLDHALRALGVLVSLFQSGNGVDPRVPLVGIEEPEVALHPAAAGVLPDSLRDASQNTQVLVTSHSPDLLDDEKLGTESILAVYAEEGATRIAPGDDVGRTALHDRRYTAGELLRLDQLRPDPQAIAETSVKQLRLFDEGKD